MLENPLDDNSHAFELQMDMAGKASVSAVAGFDLNFVMDAR